MLQIKPTAKLAGLKREIIDVLQLIAEIYQKHGYDCILTEGTGGVHRVSSKHYSGHAIDLRTKHIEGFDKLMDIKNDLTAHLGPTFDVLYEGTRRDSSGEITANEHFHIEYDPKDKGPYYEPRIR